MPIYEYRCGACGAEKEVLQKLSDPPLTQCPTCGQPEMVKLVSAAGFQLKGTGWYVTDFKHGSRPQKGAGSEEGKTGKADQADSRKSDSGKSDSGRSDSGRSDSAKSDAAKSDSAKSDSAKSDSAKSDSAKSDSARSEASGTAAAGSTIGPGGSRG